MSLSTIAALADDADFRCRVKIAAIQQAVDTNVDAWLTENIYKVAASPGFGEAYASALAQPYVAKPGENPAVITDEQIVAAVAATKPTV